MSSVQQIDWFLCITYLLSATEVSKWHYLLELLLELNFWSLGFRITTLRWSMFRIDNQISSHYSLAEKYDITKTILQDTENTNWFVFLTNKRLQMKTYPQDHLHSTDDLKKIVRYMVHRSVQFAFKTTPLTYVLPGRTTKVKVESKHNDCLTATVY